MSSAPRLKADKLEKNFTIRIPDKLHRRLEDLPAAAKKNINERVLVTLAKGVHDATFDPNEYLTDTPPGASTQAS